MERARQDWSPGGLQEIVRRELGRVKGMTAYNRTLRDKHVGQNPGTPLYQTAGMPNKLQDRVDSL
jgi:hypothetical protein